MAVVNDEYGVPYLAGMSSDRKTVYIDCDLPPTITIDGEEIDPRPFLIIHESVECYYMDAGDAYQVAHKKGIVAEKAFVEEMDIDWDLYSKALEPFIKQDGEKPITNPPPDLDPKPYEDEGDAKELAEISKAGEGNPNHDPDNGQFSSGDGGGSGGEEESPQTTQGEIKIKDEPPAMKDKVTDSPMTKEEWKIQADKRLEQYGLKEKGWKIFSSQEESTAGHNSMASAFSDPEHKEIAIDVDRKGIINVGGKYKRGIIISPNAKVQDDLIKHEMAHAINSEEKGLSASQEPGTYSVGTGHGEGFKNVCVRLATASKGGEKPSEEDVASILRPGHLVVKADIDITNDVISKLTQDIIDVGPANDVI